MLKKEKVTSGAAEAKRRMMLRTGAACEENGNGKTATCRCFEKLDMVVLNLMFLVVGFWFGLY